GTARGQDRHEGGEILVVGNEVVDIRGLGEGHEVVIGWILCEPLPDHRVRARDGAGTSPVGLAFDQETLGRSPTPCIDYELLHQVLVGPFEQSVDPAVTADIGGDREGLRVGAYYRLLFLEGGPEGRRGAVPGEGGKQACSERGTSVFPRSRVRSPRAGTWPRLVSGRGSRDIPGHRDELGLVEQTLPGAVGLSTADLRPGTGSVPGRCRREGDVAADQCGQRSLRLEVWAHRQDLLPQRLDGGATDCH